MSVCIESVLGERECGRIKEAHNLLEDEWYLPVRSEVLHGDQSLWGVHDSVSQVDQDQHRVPPQHPLLKLPPVAGPLGLDHPLADLLGQLGQLSGVGDTGDLSLTARAVLSVFYRHQHTVLGDLREREKERERERVSVI